MDQTKAPGLKWIKRRASHTPIWVASAKDYKPATVNLSHLRDHPDVMVAQCALLQAQMNAWKQGLESQDVSFDGTIASLLQKYQTEPDSPFFSLRPRSRHPYEFYVGKLIAGIGERHIDKVTGVDLKRWHDAWSRNGERLAASKMMRAVLDAAISYGVMCRIEGCMELRAALKAANRKLPNPKRRESVVTADQVVALRLAAHADGRPSCALTYALVFETTLRLWDVIGQWVPLDSPGFSDVTNADLKAKWFGIRWEDIDGDMVLRYMPSKTSMKTGMSITYPLDRAPMVVAELEHWPAEKRSGPIIVYESTGEPYGSNWFAAKWRKDRAAAGLSDKMWARDLRASGITEGRAAGISTDDAAKVAGHASTKTTSAIYDRANLEAAERFADARSTKREKGK